MNQLYCITPFTDLTINSSTIHPCTCKIWVNPDYYTPHNINVPGDTLKAWNSSMLSDFRHNLRCGNTNICDRLNCPVKNLKSIKDLKQGVPKIPSRISKNIADFLEFKSHTYNSMPVKVHLAYDYSCNLMCITCRNKHHTSAATEFFYPYVTNVSNFIQHAYVLTVTDTADPIASSHYRYILQNELPLRDDFDHITLMTNGVLFDEEFYSTIFYKRYLKTMSISIDAMTKSTYNKIRLGGDWDRLQQNIKFVQELKKSDVLQNVYVNFVIQDSNIDEAVDFTQWAISCGFDGVNFNMPMFWDTGISKDFIKMISVHTPSSSKYNSFCKIKETIQSMPIETVFAFPPYNSDL